MKKNYSTAALLFAFLVPLHPIVSAQQMDCSFKAPVVKIDFGTDASSTVLNVGSFPNYSIANYACPEDGYYAFTSTVSGRCFNNNWIELPEDHTAGDNRGRMMLVNAAYEPGTFFMHRITNLKPGTTYELAAWMLNVCSGNWGCTPHPPVISFTILSASGIQLGKFRTGQIWPGKTANWQRYYAIFDMPGNETAITLKIDNEAAGGCGNDFALDDITLRECSMTLPAPATNTSNIQPIKTATKPTTKKEIEKKIPGAVSKPVKTIAPAAPLKTPPVITKEQVNKQPIKIATGIQQNNIAVPEILKTRMNTVASRIEIPANEITIELYDNGEIDGDTVTVYHNNQLLAANAALGLKPIRFTIQLDKEHPHHELVMVANNLGSIPPNTSLMIVTAGSKRYEVFIASTEKQNASVIFDLKDNH